MHNSQATTRVLPLFLKLIRMVYSCISTSTIDRHKLCLVPPFFTGNWWVAEQNRWGSLYSRWSVTAGYRSPRKQLQDSPHLNTTSAVHVQGPMTIKCYKKAMIRCSILKIFPFHINGHTALQNSKTLRTIMPDSEMLLVDLSSWRQSTTAWRYNLEAQNCGSLWAKQFG